MAYAATRDDRQYPAELKAQIALEAIRGEIAPDQLASGNGVPVELVLAWQRELIAGAARVFKDPAQGDASASRPSKTSKKTLASLAWQESEARLNAIIESAPVGMMFKDRNRRVVLVNRTFCEFLALPRERILGRRAEQFRPAEAARLIREMDEDVLATGNVRYEEWSCLHADGDLRTYTTTKFPVKSRDGRIFGICGVVVDLTDRNRAERALRLSEQWLATVINHAPASISLKDLDGRYLLVNEEVARRYGRAPADFPGRTIFDFTDPEAAAGVTSRDREMIERGAVTQHEVASSDRDGVTRSMMVTRFPIFDGSGRVNAVGTIGIDISAQKHIEAALRLAKEAAEVASRAKTEFLANMSHELRTPLNSIIGFAQIISEEMFGPVGNPRYREYAADIYSSGHGLLELINDILDISRIEIGGMPLDEKWVDLAPLLHNAAGLVAGRASGAGLELRVEIPDGLPALRADGRRVRQIVLNLLSNAVKFTPWGGTVTLSALRDDAGRLVLAVADTGIGIPMDKIATALAMFGQVQDPMTRSHDGVGLGLPLSKKLAELHGGTLEIDSAAGRGTMVRVTFPAERTQAGPTPETGPARGPL